MYFEEKLSIKHMISRIESSYTHRHQLGNPKGIPKHKRFAYQEYNAPIRKRPTTHKPAPTNQHPETSTHKPAPITQNPASSTQHPEPSTHKPAPITQKPASSIQHPEPSIQHPEPSIQHPETSTQINNNIVECKEFFYFCLSL